MWKLLDAEKATGIELIDSLAEALPCCPPLPSRHSEFRVYSSLTRQTDQDSPISRSLVTGEQRLGTRLR